MDVTPLADLSHGQPRAGPVRERRPVYVDRMPPCNDACPAGENVQHWLYDAESGRATTGLEPARRGQSVSRRDKRAGSATTRARRRATGASSTRSGGPSQRDRAILGGSRHQQQGWALTATGGPGYRQTGSRRRRRTFGAERRLPPAPLRSRGPPFRLCPRGSGG